MSNEREEDLAALLQMATAKLSAASSEEGRRLDSTASSIVSEDANPSSASLSPTMPASMGVGTKRMSVEARQLAKELGLFDQQQAQQPAADGDDFDWYDQSPEDWPEDDPIVAIPDGDKRAVFQAIPTRLVKILAMALVAAVLYYNNRLVGVAIIVSLTFAHAIVAELTERLLFLSTKNVLWKAYWLHCRQPLISSAVLLAWLRFYDFEGNGGGRRVISCLALFAVTHLVHGFVWQALATQLNEKAFKERLLQDRYRLYIVDHLEAFVNARSNNSNEHQTPPSAWGLFRPVSYQPIPEGEQAPTVDGVDPVLRDILRYANSPPGTPVATQASDYERFEAVLQRRLSTDAYIGGEKETTAAVVGSIDNRKLKERARRIFEALAEDRRHLAERDLAAAFPQPSALADAFAVFDWDRRGWIGRRQFRDAFLHVHTKHANLVQSIRDTRAVFDQVGWMTLVLSLLVISFVALWIVRADVYVILSLAVSITLALNMTISEPIKNVLLSVIFLFVYQVYSIGDEVVVPGILPAGSHLAFPEEVLRVRRIHLTLTTFTRKASGARVYYENFKLYSQTIVNLSRTKQSWERLDFDLPLKSKSKDAGEVEEGGVEEVFRQCLRMFLVQNSRLYMPIFTLAIRNASSASSVSTSGTPVASPRRGAIRVPYSLNVRCQPSAPANIRHVRLLRFVQVLLGRLDRSSSVKEK